MSLADSRYRTDDGTVSRTLIDLLHQKKRKDMPGWLRLIEATVDMPEGYDASKMQHLFDKEKRKALDLLLLCKPHDCASGWVTHAWGVTEKSVRNIFQRQLEPQAGLSVSRKVRLDSGKTLQNSKQKRQSVYTAQFVSARQHRDQFPGQKFSQKDIDAAWAATDDVEKAVCANIAKQWVEEGGPPGKKEGSRLFISI